MNYCIHCGAKVEESSKFCTSCGTKIEEETAQAPAPVVADSDEPQGKSLNKVIIILAVALVVVLALIACLVLFVPSASSESDGVASQSQASQPQENSEAQAGSEPSADSNAAEKSGEQAEVPTSAKAMVSIIQAFKGGAGSGLLTSYSASSVLSASQYGTYVASNLDDGALDTAWVEGASGSGAGQSVKMSDPSGKKVSVSEIELVAGYAKSEDIYYKNARPKQVSVLADTGDVLAQVTLADSYKAVQSITFPATSTSSLTLRIDSVYEGNKYEDCAISEMRCY